jgi:hypothetical protein
VIHYLIYIVKNYYVRTYVQGGGWCNNARACRFRKTSRRGSSDFMEKEIPFTGIMGNSPVDNPGTTIRTACLSCRLINLYKLMR